MTYAFALLAATALSLAPGQVTPQGKSVLFRVKVRPGLHYATASKMTMSLGGRQMSYSRGTSVDVTSVRGNIATVKVTVGPQMQGNAVMKKGSSYVTKADVRFGFPDQPGSDSALSLGPSYPNGAVKVGQSWNDNRQSPFGGGGTRVFTFKGFVSRAGHRLALIDGRFHANVKDQGTSVEIQGTSTMYIDPADGLPVYEENKGTLTGAVPGTNQTQTIQMRLVSSRVAGAR